MNEKKSVIKSLEETIIAKTDETSLLRARNGLRSAISSLAYLDIQDDELYKVMIGLFDTLLTIDGVLITEEKRPKNLYTDLVSYLHYCLNHGTAPLSEIKA